EQSVVLRRFPTEGGSESEPVWIREPSTTLTFWTNYLSLDTDALGNTLVVWAETSDDGNDHYFSRLFARAVDAQHAPIGEAFPLGGDGFEWFWRVAAEDAGVFEVIASSEVSMGPVRFTVSIDPEQFPVDTTTTTTLPPSPDAPDFDLIRDIGPSGP